MQLIKLNRESVPFPGRLTEYDCGKKEVLMKLKKLQVNLAESATSLKKFALRIGDDKIVFKSDSPTSNIIRSELNDLNEPLKLKNHENEDLDLETEEGEIIDELMVDVVKIRYDNGIIEKIDEYPSYEHVNANFFPVLSINIMSKSLYNSIMKEKIEFKGKNVVGTFINVPIFVGNFSIVTDFTVLENMDDY
ncbi:hypothetical protein Tco_1204866 [Tanacetum coccineum]